MRQYRSIVTAPILAIAAAAGLSGCAAYQLDELETIPVPRPALMKDMAKPDCRTQPQGISTEYKPISNAPVKAESKAEAPEEKAAEDRDASAAKPTPEADDKQSKTDDNQANAAPKDADKLDEPTAKKVVSEPNVHDLINERDCYLRAEQMARTRLGQLQAQAAATVATLDEMKRKLSASVRAQPHDGDQTGSR
jgi:hypothetical protein